MTFATIRFVAHYERKIITRHFVYQLLLFSGFIGVAGFHVLCHSYDWRITDYFYPDLPSALPYTNAYLFCLFQLLAIVFIAGDFLYQDPLFPSNEPLISRPVSNADYVTGKSLAVVELMLGMGMGLMLFAMLLNVISSPAAFRPEWYLFYFVTLTVPCTFVLTTVTLFVKTICPSNALSLFFLLGIAVLTATLLPEWGYGLLDCTAFCVPNTFSSITGHPALGSYLSHRGFHIFLSLVLLCGSILLFSRVDNQKRTQISCLGVAAGIGTIVLAGMYIFPFIRVNQMREIYATIYRNHDSKLKTTILTNDLTVELQEKHLRAVSVMQVKNPNEQRIDTLFFYLNPTLHVEKLLLDKQPIAHQRNKQIISVPYQLKPGEQVQISLHYKGGLSEEICYPEIQPEEYHQPKYQRYFLNPGKRIIFIDKNYTLLTPEAMWYPTSLPIVNVSEPFATQNDYTQFTLRVKTPTEQIILTHGKKIESDQASLFSFEKPVAGITLIASKLTTISFPTKNQPTLNYYHFPGKKPLNGVFDCSPEGKKAGIYRYWDNVHQMFPQKKYPDSTLNIAEIPLSFHSYPKPWRNRYPHHQSNLLLVYEQEGKASLNQLKKQLIHRVPELSKEQTTTIEAILINKQLSNYNKYFTTRSASLFNIGCISKDFPIINQLFPLLGKNFEKDLRDSDPNTKLATDLNALEYLDEHSLEELSSHPEAWLFSHDIFRLKTLQLINYIQLNVSASRYDAFIHHFLNRYQHQNIQLDFFLQTLQDSLNVQLHPYLAQWYTQKGVPSFVIKKLDNGYRIINKNESVRYFLFNIKNTSSVDGIISIQKNTIDTYSTFKNIVVRAGEALKICLPMDTIPYTKLMQINYHSYNQFYVLHTNLSWNLPGNVRKVGGAVTRLTEKTKIGIHQADSNDFLPPPGTIIVDNEDPGFQISQEQVHFLQQFQKEKKRRYMFTSVFKTYPTKWTQCLHEDAYGHIRSYYHKTNSNGKAQLTWNATLPTTGKYALYVYSFSPHQIDRRRRAIHRYTLQQNSETHEINITYPVKAFFPIINIKRSDGSQEEITQQKITQPDDYYWVYVGTYDLKAGEVKMTLHDNGVNLEEYLIADAIKWVKIE